jgi:hypothetical protein
VRGALAAVLAALAAFLPACGSCGNTSQPVQESIDGGAQKIFADFDGGRTVYRARNRHQPILDTLDDSGSSP